MPEHFPGPDWAKRNWEVGEFYEDGCRPAYPTDTEEPEVRNELAGAVLRGEYEEVNLEGVGVLLVPTGLNDEIAALLNIGLMAVGYRGEQPKSRYRALRFVSATDVLNWVVDGKWPGAFPGHLATGNAVEAVWQAADVGPDGASITEDVAVSRAMSALGYGRLDIMTAVNSLEQI